MDFKVPKDLQAAIVRPFLTERAKTLIAKFNPEKVSRYEEVRNAILKQYKISATLYRDKFNDITKSDDQTFIMMTSNLFALLNSYVEARKATNLDDLRNLLVADRLKTTLIQHPYVMFCVLRLKLTRCGYPPMSSLRSRISAWLIIPIATFQNLGR